MKIEKLKLKRELNIYKPFLNIKSGNHVGPMIRKNVTGKSLKSSLMTAQKLTVQQVTRVYNN